PATPTLSLHDALPISTAPKGATSRDENGCLPDRRSGGATFSFQYFASTRARREAPGHTLDVRTRPRRHPCPRTRRRPTPRPPGRDRKSTRLNSSHVKI